MGFHIGLKDIIDILLVAIILYETYRLLRSSGMANLFWGILLFLMVWFAVSYVFQLELTGALFDRIVSVGAIALIIIFQDPIRSFFNRLGSKLNIDTVHRYFRSNKNSSDSDKVATQLVIACKNMSKTNTGALIVITRQNALRDYQQTGEQIDAQVSARLVEQIFYKNTPLHDGALFITNKKIAAAACILPVSQRQDLPLHYGLRHRAALGLSERSDALVVVVSEETGQISVADGNTLRTVKIEELSHILNAIL
jgi:uncharacterized protein (TIGR00159 family)